MTDDARFERLLELYVDGRAVPEELAELESLLRQDPALRAALVERIRVHVDLHALYEGSSEEAALAKAPAQAARPPSRRFSARHQTTSPGFPWVPGLVAAAVLIGFTAILLWSASGEPGGPSRRSGTQVRKDEAPRVERPTADVRPATPERNLEVPKPGPRKKEIEDPAERQRRIDQELKAATRPPAVADTKKPEQPTPPIPEAPKENKTVAAAPRIARILKIEGDVWVLSAGERKAPSPEQEISAGEGVETGETGSVEIGYADQTRVAFGPGSLVRDLKADGGKRFAMERGRMRAVVSKQPKGQPMVVETPSGDATVVGTTLKIVVDPNPAKGTRLDVEEGMVELKSRLTGKMVAVDSGHFAVAALGQELKKQALPIDEVLLAAAQGKISGGEWRPFKDAQGNGALETLPIFRSSAELTQATSFVTFTFEADAGRDYHLWVRGECLGKGADRGLQDGLVLRFVRCQVTQKLAADWGVVPPDSVGVSGWGRSNGTLWIGGDGDFYDPKGIRSDDRGPTIHRGDETPAVVRFTRPGTQTLRMYVFEGPMRVDAIWLSTTQKTRPDAGQSGPVKK